MKPRPEIEKKQFFEKVRTAGAGGTNPFMNLSLEPGQEASEGDRAINFPEPSKSELEQEWAHEMRKPQNILRLHLQKPITQPLLYKAYPDVKSHQTIILT